MSKTIESNVSARGGGRSLLLKEIRATPLLWLLPFVPVVLAAARLWPEAHALLFVLSVVAIVPLAALLIRATEAIAARTGDAVGGLLNATLGNLSARPGELRARPNADGSAILAGRGGDGPDRYPRRGPRHEQRAVGLVRGCVVVVGLCDLRHDVLPVAAAGEVT